jgi:hypothetical protein
MTEQEWLQATAPRPMLDLKKAKSQAFIRSER